MRNGMRSIHVVWGGWAFVGIRAGNWPAYEPTQHPTQWLDAAPCAAYFACHAKKSYFPGLNRENWNFVFLSLFDFHPATRECQVLHPLVNRVFSTEIKMFS